MPPLESLSLGKRILLAVLIVIVVLLVLLGLSRVLEGDAQAQQQDVCLDSEERGKLRELMFEAIDQGFKDQIAHLFDIWMKDYSDKNSRAATGARNAVRAHISARGHAKAWNPPHCPQ